MNRMQSFEQSWASRHGVPVESMAQYRFESREGYRLPDMAAHYRTWCEALESRAADAATVVPAVPVGEIRQWSQCRQQLKAIGKPYPRSGCEVCGQFSPRWEECDKRIAFMQVSP